MATHKRTQTVMRLLVAVVVVLLLLVAAVAVAKPGGGEAKDKAPKTFVIEGSVDGFLYPGVTEALPVVFANPTSKEISVDQVAITVGDASTVCTAESVTVGVVPVPVLVDENGETTVEVPVVLPVDAADACQGAVFPITYEGVATKQ